MGIKSQIRFNEASQTLSFEAPQGRPSSDGTVVLRDPRYSPTSSQNTILASGTAARQAVDVTVSSASGVGQTNPKRVNCAVPVALKRGDHIWLTTEGGTGIREGVEVAAIDDANLYFDCVEPLRQAYVTGDKIQSSVMTSAAVPTAWVQDLVNLGIDYEAVWTYTVDGRTYVEVARWDLVREVFSQEFEDLERRFLARYPDAQRWSRAQKDPGMFRRMSPEVTREVDELLIRAGYKNPNLVRGHEIAGNLHLKLMMWWTAINGWKPPGLTVEKAGEIYEESANALLGGQLKIPYDHDEDGILDADDYQAQAVELIR